MAKYEYEGRRDDNVVVTEQTDRFSTVGRQINEIYASFDAVECPGFPHLAGSLMSSIVGSDSSLPVKDDQIPPITRRTNEGMTLQSHSNMKHISKAFNSGTNHSFQAILSN